MNIKNYWCVKKKKIERKRKEEIIFLRIERTSALIDLLRMFSLVNVRENVGDGWRKGYAIRANASYSFYSLFFLTSRAHIRIHLYLYICILACSLSLPFNYPRRREAHTKEACNPQIKLPVVCPSLSSFTPTGLYKLHALGVVWISHDYTRITFVNFNQKLDLSLLNFWPSFDVCKGKIFFF